MNIFSILNLGNERYHNRMLAWLLNPTESHNLGSQFLAGFLGLVNIEHSPNRFRHIKTEHYVYASDSVERRRPDIYIQTDGYSIFIENKVRNASIDDIELKDQANYISDYASAMHILIVPILKDIPKSTKILIDHYNIHILEWSRLIKILNETLEAKEDIAEDIQIILKQYSDYVKQYIINRPPSTDLSLSLEDQIREHIGVELEELGRAVLERFTQTSDQNDWKMYIKTDSRPDSTNWIVQLSPPKYPDIVFEVNLKFFPYYGNTKRLLYTSVGLILDSNQVVSRFANTVHRHFEKFKGSSAERYRGKSNLDANVINSGRYEYREDIHGYPLDRLDKWQIKKKELLERAVEWIKEFLPIFEEKNSSEMAN
ncbi:MAG: PD-(D/E)XK nuclease family protein [Chloroflexi bacterium]|nr:PD-(D/E)XK nuclease family protein [Chloroflexota bacterium]